MSVSYEFSSDDRLCILRLNGVVTVDAMIDNVRSALADPKWSNEYRFLSIMADVILEDISADQTSEMVRRLGELDAPLASGRRMRAAIACSDEMAEALLVYYEYRSKGDRMTDERFFRSEAEARAWLASPEES